MATLAENYVAGLNSYATDDDAAEKRALEDTTGLVGNTEEVGVYADGSACGKNDTWLVMDLSPKDRFILLLDVLTWTNLPSDPTYASSVYETSAALIGGAFGVSAEAVEKVAACVVGEVGRVVPEGVVALEAYGDVWDLNEAEVVAMARDRFGIELVGTLAERYEAELRRLDGSIEDEAKYPVACATSFTLLFVDGSVWEGEEWMSSFSDSRSAVYPTFAAYRSLSPLVKMDDVYALPESALAVFEGDPSLWPVEIEN